MKEFENINTTMPYKESEAYVDALVERSSKAARMQGRVLRRMNRTLFYSLSVAAVAAAVVLAVVIPSHRNSFQRGGSPIEIFLASITDSEAQMIVDWPVEDIPEYY